MSQIEIVDETEESGRWRFAAHVLDDSGELHRIALTLTWSDYNLWSPAGADAPAAVAAAALEYIANRTEAVEIPARLDASYARRLAGDADTAIPGLIR